MCDFSYNFDTSRPGTAVRVSDLISIQYCDLHIRRKLARRAAEASSGWRVPDMHIASQEARYA